MGADGERAPHLDLDHLAPEVVSALRAAVAGEPVVLLSEGHPVGVLQVRVPGADPEDAATMPDRLSDGARPPEEVVVVATAMALSEAARRRLSDELGDRYIVVDFAEAPHTADVLLVPAVSPQLLARLRSEFPDARIIITEIEDEELGIAYSGPVSRLLGAGASAYLPPRPIAEIAVGLHNHLTRAAQPALEGRAAADSDIAALPPRQIDRS